MKKRLLLLLFAALSLLPAFGYDFTVDGIYYNKTGSSTCCVTDNNSSYNSYSGAVIIPESVSYNGVEYSVTSIGNMAFYGCSGLTSVTIPNSVTSIGDVAFTNCSGLTSITLGNSLTTIGESAFEGCSGLTSVTIPSSVTSIGDYAFTSCSGLTGELTIPNSVTSIGNSAFKGCSGLTSITLGNSLTIIGNVAFYGCSELTEVHISNLEAWCKILFENENANPLYYAHHLFLNGEEVKDIVIPNSITKIGNYTFAGCSGLTSITLGNSLTTIGKAAFSGCSGLTSVTIPNSVTSIGYYAFEGIYGLSKIISNAITPPAISNDTFSEETYASALVIIPKGTLNSYQTEWSKFQRMLEELDDQDITIEQAGTLMNMLNPSEVNNITSLKLSGTLNGTDLLTLNKIPNIMKLDLSDATIVSGGMSYYEKDNIKYETEDNTLGKFWAYALNFLEEVKLPKNLLSIEESAFYNKNRLKNIIIPGSVECIGNAAFRGCSSLTNLIIEDGTSTLILSDNTDHLQREFCDCPLETVYLGRNLFYSIDFSYNRIY